MSMLVGWLAGIGAVDDAGARDAGMVGDGEAVGRGGLG
jgi:hypothetical protein